MKDKKYRIEIREYPDKTYYYPEVKTWFGWMGLNINGSIAFDAENDCRFIYKANAEKAIQNRKNRNNNVEITHEYIE